MSSSSILMFDPEEEEFVYLGASLVTPRKDHTTVLLPQGHFECSTP